MKKHSVIKTPMQKSPGVCSKTLKSPEKSNLLEVRQLQINENLQNQIENMYSEFKLNSTQQNQQIAQVFNMVLSLQKSHKKLLKNRNQQLDRTGIISKKQLMMQKNPESSQLLNQTSESNCYSSASTINKNSNPSNILPHDPAKKTMKKREMCGHLVVQSPKAKKSLQQQLGSAENKENSATDSRFFKKDCTLENETESNWIETMLSEINSCTSISHPIQLLNHSSSRIFPKCPTVDKQTELVEIKQQSQEILGQMRGLQDRVRQLERKISNRTELNAELKLNQRLQQVQRAVSNFQKQQKSGLKNRCSQQQENISQRISQIQNSLEKHARDVQKSVQQLSSIQETQLQEVTSDFNSQISSFEQNFKRQIETSIGENLQRQNNLSNQSFNELSVRMTESEEVISELMKMSRALTDKLNSLIDSQKSRRLRTSFKQKQKAEKVSANLRLHSDLQKICEESESSDLQSSISHSSLSSMTDRAPEESECI